MKKLLLLIVCTLLSLSIGAADKQSIRINTDNIDLILQVSPKNRLYQVYLGEKLNSTADFNHFTWNTYPGSDGGYSIRGREAYPGSGGEDMFEPALAITHADGNQTTYLYYQSSSQKAIPGGTETIIQLADDKYAVQVTLHYVAYSKENVIKTWSEIKHNEKSPITLWRYASGMFYFNSSKYFLTNYHGDWASEGQPAVQQLQFGKKIVDTKLGTRAAEQSEPFFELGFDQPAQESQGRVMLGTIGWTGNFSFTFEIDNVNCLRVIPAINSYASNYKLKAGETFKTPEFIFTLSESGTGQASRNLQNWARKYQLWNGEGDRMTLLNNWENTAFDFNQEKLAQLMKDAKDLGVDMFLLDDGWFANKYPRKDDRAGLGDWEPTRTKLPDGIPALTKAAEEAGVKFGIWIEPEMVNPKSELYEKHKNWVIELPNRETYYYRHQLVLDLSNPEVQDYVFNVVDRLMTENPNIAYFKWDCNSAITNIYSPYQKANQGNLYIEYVRLYIQYSMSKFFPSKALASHVTNWNRRTSVKFRTDVASMCKLGFDIDLKTMKPEDYKFTQEAVANWNRLKNVILDGELYRLVSPYETQHMSVNYVSQDKSKAVLFAYDLHPRYSEPQQTVRLQGLDANRTYFVKEINLMPNSTSSLQCNEQRYTGDYLMKVGLMVLSAEEGSSRVLELTAE